MYSLDLRARSLHYIAVREPQSGKKKQRELATLKRIDANAIADGPSQGAHDYPRLRPGDREQN